jgi:hypothetical protein
MEAIIFFMSTRLSILFKSLPHPGYGYRFLPHHAERAGERLILHQHTLALLFRRRQERGNLIVFLFGF